VKKCEKLMPCDCSDRCKEKRIGECNIFVSCGGKDCLQPCYKCLFWTNYGGVLQKRLEEQDT
jgi:hypothetical protein